MDPNPSVLVGNHASIEIDSSDSQPSKRRKKKSMVWDHFTTETSGPGTTKAFCKHCNKSYAYITGAKASGTSHLKRHIELGICAVCPKTNLISQIKDETTSCPPKKRQRSPANVPLDQDRCNHEMAKMIIMHDYPLHMVEHPGFAGFVKALRPQFSMASFDTIHGDCVKMFLSQKQKLSDFIGEIPGAVNLTVDLWSSKQSVGYAFVTGHFVDKDWNLTHRLLNVAVVASPDSDFALNQPIAACLSEWKLEGKISSLTVSQSLVNKTCIDNLRVFLSVRNQHVLNGQLLMGKCYARLLSSMAQDALAVEQLQASIKKIRDSIKFVKTNETCGDKFDELKKLFPTPAPYSDLLVDNQTRWDTSYNMLLAAYEHRQVFSCLETCYPDYKIAISPEEWRKIESLCSCLKVLFEAGNVLTRPNHLTANDLYYEMTKLQLELSHAAMGEDPDVRNLANSLREKFDLYWRGCFLVLAVAVVMDPRFKMQQIKVTFTESYGEDAEKWIETVSDAVHDLYLNYSEHNLLDAYVDHGFSETEVAQEPHFQQDMPQDANTANGQSGDETSLQVEQSTESHPIAGEEQQLGDDSQAHPIAEGDHSSFTVEQTTELDPIAEEEQQLGDDSRAHPIAEGDHPSFTVEQTTELHPVAEEEQQLGDDARAHPIAEGDHPSLMVEQTTESHPVTEEEQQLGDDSRAHPIAEGDHPSLMVEQTTESHPVAEEEQQLGDDSRAHPIAEGDLPSLMVEQTTESHPVAEEEQQLGDDSRAHAIAEGDHPSLMVEQTTESHPIAEEEQQLVDDSQAHPVEEGDQPSFTVEQTTESHQHVRQPKVEKQNLEGVWEAVTEECQLTEKDQQLGDDSQAHPLAEEDHTLFTGDVLLQEGSTLVTIGDSLSDFEIYISEMKTELDQYLDESLVQGTVSEDFDVLSWWRLNSTNYPTLSKIAADLLSIPFSTVSPDSVFDTEVKQIDNYRTSLPRVTLEALLCTKDWLKNQTL